jgi:3-methyladenine DNA glycosylase/8-oxoguanine DNA glycosylase
MVDIFFNGEVEAPEFHIGCSESLSKEEVEEVNEQLARVLGTDLDTRALYDKAGNDTVLGPYLNEYYGLKRISRATLFEEAVNRIVQMNLSHKPTARKMMYRLREKYGNAIMTEKGSFAAWPRPDQLLQASPEQIRACGPTVRKGEYIIRIAEQIVANEVDFDWLDHKADPETFVNTLVKLKGIGPSAAQQLVLTRNRTDGAFPSTKKSGEETGLRRWIILSYGADPDSATDADFQSIIHSWQGYEAIAIEFLYLNWIHSYKRKKQAKKK